VTVSSTSSARALRGNLRRPGRATALNPDQAAIVQGTR
jgi:hypothetical protein